MPASHTGMPLQILATLLPKSFHLMGLGSRRQGLPRNLGPHHQEGRCRWHVLDSVWPSLGYCGHWRRTRGLKIPLSSLPPYHPAFRINIQIFKKCLADLSLYIIKSKNYREENINFLNFLSVYSITSKIRKTETFSFFKVPLVVY